MHIHVSPRHVPLTAAIHQKVAAQLSALEEHSPNILAAHVVLIHDAAAAPAQRYTVKVHLALAGPDVFAEDSENNLYVAMERVTDKLDRQLRKRKTARTDKVRKTSQRAAESARATGELPPAIQKTIAAKGGGRASASVRKRSSRAH